MNNLIEKSYNTRVVHKGNAISFRVDKVILPDGKIAVREFIDHPGAVAVLAFIDGRIVFVKQYRYPVGEITYEIPAGKLHNKSDNFLKRAKAELKEETGYSAGKLIHLIDFWPTPAFSNELLKIYLAVNLKKGRQNLDKDEFLNVVEIEENKIQDMILSGKIKDSKTIIALFYYFLIIKKGDGYGYR